MSYFANQRIINFSRVDGQLAAALIALMSIGLVLVASSSIEFAAERYGDAWLFVRKQFIFLLMGIVGGLIIFMLPLDVWRKYSSIFLALGIISLIVVLIPGIGKMVNGSRRWLPLGPFAMQASELAKLCMIVFFAGYLDRRLDYVRSKWSAFFIMTGLIGLVVLLLLLEPDFGSSVVLCLALGAMMFVAGVPLLRFLLLALSGVVALALIAVMSPYRWTRLITFMDPWERKFDSGYQLVQSLTAFGSGEYFGVGLGNSVQKLLYLPEAHTDFVFSVFFEEFGLFGAVILIALVVFMIFKVIGIALDALNQKNYFGAFLCVGIGMVLAVQSLINMGVASGALPTKGLTFPLVSYGGSSLLITFAMLTLVFRVKWELANEK